MLWFAVLLIATIADLAWVGARARREWTRSDDLSPATGIAISSLYVLAVALIVLAVALRPWPLAIPLAVALGLGALLAVGGTALVVIGARPFGSVPRLYGVEAGGLVEGGVYRISRNPQYAGLILVAAGIGLGARSGLALAVAALVAAGLWAWVVAVEEPHLDRAFGERYRGYRARVPRFLGLPRSA